MKEYLHLNDYRSPYKSTWNRSSTERENDELVFMIDSKDPIGTAMEFLKTTSRYQDESYYSTDWETEVVKAFYERMIKYKRYAHIIAFRNIIIKSSKGADFPYQIYNIDEVKKCSKKMFNKIFEEEIKSYKGE